MPQRVLAGPVQAALSQRAYYLDLCFFTVLQAVFYCFTSSFLCFLLFYIVFYCLHNFLVVFLLFYKHNGIFLKHNKIIYKA